MGRQLIDILIPVLSRPRNAAPLVESIRESTSRVPHRVTFLCSPGDTAQIEAAMNWADVVTVVKWEPGPGDFAKKINLGIRQTFQPWLLLGADDLHFHDGWAEAALETARETGKRVIATNDKANPEVMRGRHATHPLVARSYIEEYGTIDGEGFYHEGYDHQCNPPDAPIWMSDMSFRPLDEVRVGDEVVGWERGVPTSDRAALRRLKRATVTAKNSRWSDLIWVHLESGRSLRCTPDHLWLNPIWSGATGREGEYAVPKVGRYLSHVVEPLSAVPAEHERLAGWLGGIFDGEGSGTSNPQIGQSLSHNPAVYNRICETLRFFDIPFTRAPDRVWLTGGRYEWMRFLHIAQPTKRIGLIEQVIGSSRFGKKDKIVAIEPDRMGEVMSLTTTTGNYVAWGYASKNCVDVEATETARMRGEFAFSAGSVVRHLHPIFNSHVPMDSTYEKALRDGQRDRDLMLSRRVLWNPGYRSRRRSA